MKRLALIVFEPVEEEVADENKYDRWHPVHSSVVDAPGYPAHVIDAPLLLLHADAAAAHEGHETYRSTRASTSLSSMLSK